MTERNYLNFDLTFIPDGGGYRVEVKSAGAEPTATIQWPFTDQELEELRAAAEGPARDLRLVGQTGGARVADYRARVRLFGERLFDAVFSDSIFAQLELGLTRARDEQRAGVRIRIRLDQAPALAEVPWEYLYRRDTKKFLSIYEETPIVRYLGLPFASPTLLTQPPIRVLVMISDPVDLPRLQVEKEWQTIEDAFRDLQASNLVSLTRLPRATIRSLRTHLQQSQYHVFHFIGHGDFQPGPNAGQDEAVLCIEDDNGQARKINAEDLNVALDHPPLRLAVLNACEGAQTSVHDPFAGVAQGLVLAGIPATVAMQFRITDKAAILFADSFYNALANNLPIDRALVQARKIIFTEQNPTEWGTPVLFMRVDDGRIFQIDRPTEEQIRQRQIEALSADAKALIDNRDFQGAMQKVQAILQLLRPAAAPST